MLCGTPRLGRRSRLVDLPPSTTAVPACSSISAAIIGIRSHNGFGSSLLVFSCKNLATKTENQCPGTGATAPG